VKSDIESGTSHPDAPPMFAFPCCVHDFGIIDLLLMGIGCITWTFQHFYDTIFKTLGKFLLVSKWLTFWWPLYCIHTIVLFIF